MRSFFAFHFEMFRLTNIQYSNKAKTMNFHRPHGDNLTIVRDEINCEYFDGFTVSLYRFTDEIDTRNAVFIKQKKGNDFILLKPENFLLLINKMKRKDVGNISENCELQMFSDPKGNSEFILFQQKPDGRVHFIRFDTSVADLFEQKQFQITGIQTDLYEFEEFYNEISNNMQQVNISSSLGKDFNLEQEVDAHQIRIVTAANSHYKSSPFYLKFQSEEDEDDDEDDNDQDVTSKEIWKNLLKQKSGPTKASHKQKGQTDNKKSKQTKKF